MNLDVRPWQAPKSWRGKIWWTVSHGAVCRQEEERTYAILLGGALLEGLRRDAGWVADQDDGRDCATC